MQFAVIMWTLSLPLGGARERNAGSYGFSFPLKVFYCVFSVMEGIRSGVDRWFVTSFKISLRKAFIKCKHNM